MTERKAKPKNEHEPEEDNETPLLEWIAGAVGALMFVAALVVLVGEAMKEKAPPEIVARVIAVESQADGFLLSIEVANRGDKPAEEVAVTVSSGTETREVVVDFIAPRSVREAGVFLSQRPDPTSVEIEAKGYLVP